MSSRGKRSRAGTDGRSLRETALDAEGSLLEQALSMVTGGGRVVVCPGASGFDGRVALVGDADGWRAVTIGLSSPDVEASQPGLCGRGYELSMALPAGAVDLTGGRPWVVDALSSVALLAQQGARFGPGSRLRNATPLDGDPASVRSHLLFTQDTLLGSVTTPDGTTIRPLQLVPVDEATLDRAQSTSTEAVLAELTLADPSLVVRLRP